MSSRKSVLFVLPLIMLVMMSCQAVTFSNERVRGSGNVTTEERQVSGFNQVSLSGSGDMTIIQGDQEKLVIEAEDNILPLIQTEVRGNELRIGFKNGVSVSTTQPIRYTLYAKDLSLVNVSGSGNISTDSLQTQDLRLGVSGSSNMNIQNLNANSLNVTVSGSGNFDLSGQANTQDINISGSGNYRAGDLESSNVTIIVSGSGDATVWVKDELTARISGGGNVKYYGQPRVQQTVSGSGTINSLGDHQ